MKGFLMKCDHSTLSMVRAASPFAVPPRVLVVADDEDAGQAVALVERLESIGADAEARFGEGTYTDRSHRDAVIVADRRGYRFTQYHAGLEQALLAAKL
jgi:hypothetical protein